MLCIRGESARVEKGYQAHLAGAVGMILANNVSDGDGVIADAHMLPASHIGYADGQRVLAYISSTRYTINVRLSTLYFHKLIFFLQFTFHIYAWIYLYIGTP